MTVLERVSAKARQRFILLPTTHRESLWWTDGRGPITTYREPRESWLLAPSPGTANGALLALLREVTDPLACVVPRHYPRVFWVAMWGSGNRATGLASRAADGDTEFEALIAALDKVL